MTTEANNYNAGTLSYASGASIGDSRLLAWRMAIGFSLVLTLAILDVYWPYLNFAVGYVIPLILLAAPTQKKLWRVTAVLLALTFACYSLKYTINPLPDHHIWSYRVLNRLMVAIMLVTLTAVLRYWTRPNPVAREEEADDSKSISLNVDTIREDFDAVMALAVCAPLVLAIAITDFYVPANFNVAILYFVPLWVSAWTRSRALMWSLLFVLLVLSTVGYLAGPPALSYSRLPADNRAMAIAAMILEAIALHLWIGDARRADGTAATR